MEAFWYPVKQQCLAGNIPLSDKKKDALQACSTQGGEYIRSKANGDCGVSNTVILLDSASFLR